MQATLVRSERFMTAGPSPAAEDPRPAAFVSLLNDLLPKVYEQRATREYALDFGLTEVALERYVSGACSLYERQETQSALCHCPWAMKRVVEMAKERHR